MNEKEAKLVKGLAVGIICISALLFLYGTIMLVTYDAKEHSFATIEGSAAVTVEDGNDGYRVYTSHSVCEDVDIEIVYYVFGYERSEVIWEQSCGSGLYEFRPSSSGDLLYIGTISGYDELYPDEYEVKSNFNITSSHEIVLSDRAPINKNIGLRNAGFILFSAGTGLFAYVARTYLSSKIESGELHQERLESTSAQSKSAVVDALDAIVEFARNSDKNIEQLFKDFDKNNDDFINHFELFEGLTRMGVENITPDSVGELVRILDLDGDGRIMFYELTAYLHSKV